jgi:hypothetical protein
MLIGLAMTGSATLARADVKDYEFQLIDKTEQLVSATQRLMIVVPLALFLIFLLLFFSLGSIPDAHVFGSRSMSRLTSYVLSALTLSSCAMELLAHDREFYLGEITIRARSHS